MRKDRVMDIHNRETTTTLEAHVEYNESHQPPVVVAGQGFKDYDIDEPDLLKQNPVPFLTVHASRFPNGITITDFGILTFAAATTYSVDLKKYTSPTDGSPVTIETVATSASREAEDNGTIDNPDVDAGDIIVLNLPADDIDNVYCWMTFTIL